MTQLKTIPRRSQQSSVDPTKHRTRVKSSQLASSMITSKKANSKASSIHLKNHCNSMKIVKITSHHSCNNNDTEEQYHWNQNDFFQLINDENSQSESTRLLKA